jgi:hypothetical protein
MSTAIDMNMTHYRLLEKSVARVVCAIVVALLAASLSACQKNESTQTEHAPEMEAATPAADEAPVALTEEQIEKIGIKVAPAKVVAHTPEVLGFGVVISHDALAQAVSEITTAKAAVNQSRAAQARVKRLEGTPGAFGTEAQETAERQALIDAAALALAQQKLSVALGESSAWQGAEAEARLNELASGRVKLVRVTFPLGALRGAVPRTLRLARLDPNSPTDSWTTSKVWDAPADANVPGHSFFALLKAGNIGEGEHLQVWAPSGTPLNGVLVPESAVIVSDGKYWCYIQVQTGKFVRKLIDTSRPMSDGYFVTDNIAADDSIVISSAGLLLARETNSSSEAE